MAAYAALLSLIQTTDLNKEQGEDLSSIVSRKKINDFLEYVNLLLVFLEENPAKASRWEGRIRKAANDVEDIIEGFMLQQRQSSHVRMNPSSLELEGQIEGAKEKMGLILGEMMDDEAPGYLLAAAAAPSLSTPAPTSSDAVIGLDGDLMAIKERVCGESPSLEVIPIVGMGGIGKTTLARTIYDDPLIIESFYIRVWLTVSQDYSRHKLRKTLFDSIMKLLGKEMSRHDEIIDEDEMQLKSCQNFMGRKYLIVMDDVWDTKVWDDVRHIFPDDENGSRIMLTTRESAVAAYPDPCSSLHKMQLMNNDQSWDLLKQKVFKNSICPRNLESVGKEIARKCAGLPLAVVLVAGFLPAVEETAAFWNNIAENVNPVELDDILSLSYSHLPHHLRSCFLFLGGFPEDKNIRVSKLIKLWVAEGFTGHHENGSSKSLEEEAEEYLEDLVKRNLVLVSSRRSNGKIKNCKLHDMVRDLCIQIARGDKFLHVINRNVRPQGLISERRINFNRDDIDRIWSPTIRTILCFKEQWISSCLAVLGQFRLLRVLDIFDSNYIDELPSQLFELFYLRYLAVRFTTLTEKNIPSAISNLVNLQTIIIYSWAYWRRRKHGSAFDFYLPSDIWRMPQLRHIAFCGLYILPHPPHGLLPLQNLQTLSPVTNLVWNDLIVQMIPNVKKLGLVYTIKQEYYHFHYLRYLDQLQELELIGYKGISWVGQNLTFPRALKKLILVGGGLSWKNMTTNVGSLPNLEVLKLRGGACVGETWETTEEGFPELKLLLIDESDLQRKCLQHWITQSSHFPKLKRLVLLQCRNLMEIPDGIGEISTLELIEVGQFGTKKSLVESARRIKEDQESDGIYDLQVRLR